MPPTCKTSAAGVLLALVCILWGTTRARAHDPFTSWTHARIGADAIDLDVALARSSALLLLPGAGTLPTITHENLESYRERLHAAGAQLFEITAAGAPLTPAVLDVRISGEENDIEFHLRYPRPPSGPLRFTGRYFEHLVDDHVGTLVVKNHAGQDLGWEPLSLQTPSLELPLPARPAVLTAAPGAEGVMPASTAGTAEAEPVPAVQSPAFSTFLQLGIEHILAGYDHLLFLGGLLLACRRFRTMAVIITCFTVAHSITLGLAALDVVVVPASVVEPLIAASIVFVGVENILRRRGGEPRGRGALTFGFGLIHGFGFAGALKAIGIGQHGSSLVMPLFSFNLGVELGQLAVAALCLPGLVLLRRNTTFATYGPPALSVVVAAAGFYWLLERTVWA